MNFCKRTENQSKISKKLCLSKIIFITVGKTSEEQADYRKMEQKNQYANSKCKKHDLTPCSDTKLMRDDDEKRTNKQ